MSRLSTIVCEYSCRDGDRGRSFGSIAWRSVRPILIGVPLVFALWGVGMLVPTFFQPAGKPVAVFAPGGMNRALRVVIAADGFILQVRGGTVIAISDDGGFALRLYRAGATPVIAAQTGGCIVAPPSSPYARSPPAPSV